MDSDPIQLFQAWYAQARETVRRLDVVALATASRECVPSVRMVSFKGLHNGGFVFCTDLRSRKGRELLANPQAALTFYWPEVNRQIRVEGACIKLPEIES